MSDYKCPYCGCKYEHDIENTPEDIYYVECEECGKTFSYDFYYEPHYRTRKILFPERDDAETIASECWLLGLNRYNFDGNYREYLSDKERLVSMLTPISNKTIPLRESFPVVVWHDGRFKARDSYNYDNYKGLRYVYKRLDFDKVVDEWRKTSQFRKDG